MVIASHVGKIWLDHNGHLITSADRYTMRQRLAADCTAYKGCTVLEVIRNGFLFEKMGEKWCAMGEKAVWEGKVVEGKEGLRGGFKKAWSGHKWSRVENNEGTTVSGGLVGDNMGPDNG